MRQGLTALLFAAALLPVVGCGVNPVKVYDGPTRREEDLALLRGGGSGAERGPMSLVDLRLVDGTLLRKGTYYVAVLPGRHRVAFEATARIATETRTQYCAMDLETVAGCTYSPSPPSPPSDAGTGAWEWNVDVVVAATCLQGSYQVRVSGRCGSSMKLIEAAP